MKGYYKNWYQHYLEEEKKKDQELKRGYFSNLPKEQPEEQEEQLEKTVEELSVEEIPAPPKKRRRRIGCLGVLLPLSTILGFLFLWYQLDIGPIRDLVNEGMVLVGIREESEHIRDDHVALLEQHEAFMEEVGALDFDEGMDLADLHELYEQLQEAHEYVIDVSTEPFDEAIRLWGFKLTSVSQMMNALENEHENLDDVFEEFMEDQIEIGNMIREELELE